MQESCSAGRKISSSEGQAELVVFALSGRDVYVYECEKKVRIPLGKKPQHNICNAELCKGFLRGKTCAFFSKCNPG